MMCNGCLPDALDELRPLPSSSQPRLIARPPASPSLQLQRRELSLGLAEVARQYPRQSAVGLSLDQVRYDCAHGCTHASACSWPAPASLRGVLARALRLNGRRQEDCAAAVSKASPQAVHLHPCALHVGPVCAPWQEDAAAMFEATPTQQATQLQQLHDAMLLGTQQGDVPPAHMPPPGTPRGHGHTSVSGGSPRAGRRSRVCMRICIRARVHASAFESMQPAQAGSGHVHALAKLCPDTAQYIGRHARLAQLGHHTPATLMFACSDSECIASRPSHYPSRNALLSLARRARDAAQRLDPL